MLEVKKVSKQFSKKVGKTEVVNFFADKEVSFKLESGSILGILGPNGAGKTTLLRMISGIMEPTSGNIIVDKMDYKNDSLEIKRKLAFLSGNTKLYKDISPVELLQMCGEYYEVDKEVLNRRIAEIIERFDMKDFAYQKIENLSTGQYQRVSIARCLVHDPEYYVLDEATSGLDVISRQVIIDFILEEKQRGKSIIYSTHYMEEAEDICDNIIMMNKGKVIIEGTSNFILKKTKTKNLRDAFFKLVSEGDK